MEPTTTLAVRHEPDQLRFALFDGDTVVGIAEYTVAPDHPRERIFVHTEIHPDYEGKGAAGQLARETLAATIDEGVRIVAVCPFIKGYLERHPEYASHVEHVRRHHLQAIRSDERWSGVDSD